MEAWAEREGDSWGGAQEGCEGLTWPHPSQYIFRGKNCLCIHWMEAWRQLREGVRATSGSRPVFQRPLTVPAALHQNLTIVFLLRLQPGIAPDFTAPHIMDWPVSQIQYLVPGLNSSNTLFDLQHHCWQLCGAQQVRLIMDFPTSTKVSYETLESCVRYRWLLATTTRNSTDNDNDASYVNCDRNFDENDDKNDQKHINIWLLSKNGPILGTITWSLILVRIQE